MACILDPVAKNVVTAFGAAKSIVGHSCHMLVML
jgi:hypothetical protein